jgi:hypothetical protein
MLTPSGSDIKEVAGRRRNIPHLKARELGWKTKLYATVLLFPLLIYWDTEALMTYHRCVCFAPHVSMLLNGLAQHRRRRAAAFGEFLADENNTQFGFRCTRLDV